MNLPKILIIKCNIANLLLGTDAGFKKQKFNQCTMLAQATQNMLVSVVFISRLNYIKVQLVQALCARITCSIEFFSFLKPSKLELIYGRSHIFPPSEPIFCLFFFGSTFLHICLHLTPTSLSWSSLRASSFRIPDISNASGLLISDFISHLFLVHARQKSLLILSLIFCI